MQISGKRRLLVVPALAALVLTAMVVGRADAAVGPVGAVADQALLEPGDVYRCEGKAQLRAAVLTKIAPTTIGETGGVFVPLTDASISVAGPAAAASTDQVIVTFTGEALLTGQPNVLAPVVDAVQVRILVNGAPLPPGAVVFTTDAGQSDALQACAIVTGPGPHVVTVQWRLFDFASNSALTGTLRTWELHVEQND
ncbi:hypothetical protein [Micromonospora sp. NBC_01796]|uniref:hypothetical protein n=1 Tax=Micromonospora sp. NBC_01796 TaxID=2975987 RepID=UPI002DD92EF4|nr:hypothetical protein [Micromonospora sp. NBC_01796]WSA84223.1 hypothetical protein OIE47_28255 [Micromonospora sp. NBC_01796]